MDSRGSGDSCKQLLGGGAGASSGARELTEAEAAIKRTQATEWFKQASSINASQGQTLEEKMQAFRLRRAGTKETTSSDCSKENPRGYAQAISSNPVPKDASSGSSSTTVGTKPSQSASSGPAAAGRRALEAARAPAAGAEGSAFAPGRRPGSAAGSADAAATTPVEASASGSRGRAATDPESLKGDTKQKPSLLEKFGYGVKPKQEPKREVMDMRSFTKKKTVMVEVKAGENDLLDRLRRKGSRSGTPIEA